MHSFPYISVRNDASKVSVSGDNPYKEIMVYYIKGFSKVHKKSTTKLVFVYTGKPLVNKAC